MLAVAFESIPVSNCPDTCDSLHVINLTSYVVLIASVHANVSFKVLVT